MVRVSIPLVNRPGRPACDPSHVPQRSSIQNLLDAGGVSLNLAPQRVYPGPETIMDGTYLHAESAGHGTTRAVNLQTIEMTIDLSKTLRRYRNLIASGPRPPQTPVTTEAYFATFGPRDPEDLPGSSLGEQLADAAAFHSPPVRPDEQEVGSVLSNL